MNHYSVYLSVTNDGPATKDFASTDVSATADTINISSHGYKTGLLVTATTTGALPTGLDNTTNYYVSVVDASTIALSTSRANAIAGTKINIAADGSGTNSLKPTAIAGLDVHLEVSIDGSNYFDVAGSTLAAAGSTMMSYSNIAYPYVRVESTLTAGQITVTAKARSIGLIS
jgi:hypothetical protein